MADVVVGGDLTLSAKELRRTADKLEEAGDPLGAKDHNEAAHRLDEAAAWLRKERRGKEAASG